ncbi:DUF885 domain-containing protein [Parasediminibacterium sp. JCM 36343]|uniref:DUF885 domain-containing protein n=1 Tax=Parasediminibacterium sp. JCM 36343 TaxID=3374279 RepID=UPI00397BA589
MKQSSIFLMIATLFFASCKLNSETKAEATQPAAPDKDLAALFVKYHDEELQFFPTNATTEGDNRFNDKLPIDFTDAYRDSTKRFYNRYNTLLAAFDKSKLNEQDQLSYDLFKYNLDIYTEALKYPDNYMPFNQFVGLTLTMGQLGSGEGAQPFKTVEDYDNWIKRGTAFNAWADSAIVYFKKGIAANYVLPKALVVKMIPQMKDLVTTDATKNLFYGPIKKLPATFSDTDKKRFATAYTKLINEQIVPAYKKLGDFLQNEYLPKARATSGYSDLPDGKNYYAFLAKQQTTTTKTPDEIYNLGLSEVKRIRSQMDSVKNAVHFTGDLPAFFEFMKTDKQFMPYKKPTEVLAAFEKIHQTMQPQLQKEFIHVPKTKFEIRQTEAFRAASASAEYNQGSADGSRPGIFYVPILDATKFNTTSGMESLFLHEAIPGHHYQISLQQEDTTLPKFRRFGGQNAYVEGWALYCESLGKELGLYTDPYQYMGALGDEIHRAIRLVVDVAIHTKGMTREQAIKYMMDNEAISEQGATAEIERYMAIPGQALGYKIGALKIRELRTKYEKALGSKFNLGDFHDQILKDGSMPLALLETKMDKWAEVVSGK